MKKILYMIAIAAMAIVSCTKDNTKEVNLGQAIDFRVATTRATETNIGNLDKIWVTAISETATNHFTKVEFAKDGNYFVTPNAYYWPADGSNLTFYSYAPYEYSIGCESVTIDGTTQKITGFAPATNVKDQIDLITCVTSGNKNTCQGGVELLFDHALSQIEIQAYSNNTGYVQKVKGVRIGKVGSKGDYDFALRGWDLNGDKADYEITFDTPVRLEAAAQSIMGSEGNAMLIPQTLTPWDQAGDKENTNEGTYVAVLINIETTDGAVVFPETRGEYAWSAFPLEGEWVRGFKYIYKLDFTDGAGFVEPGPEGGEEVMGGKIKFTHYIYGWNTSYPTDTDVEME